jgi:hypothetical protein
MRSNMLRRRQGTLNTFLFGFSGMFICPDRSSVGAHFYFHKEII